MAEEKECTPISCSATQIPEEIWEVVCAYLSTNDLLNLCLSCKKVYQHASTLLWEVPSNHFGSGMKAHDAFFAFLQALPHVRPQTRAKTRTLDLSLLLAYLGHDDITPDFPANWTAKLMIQLPQLEQFRIAPNIPRRLESVHAIRNLCKEVWFGSPNLSLLALEMHHLMPLDAHKLSTMLRLYPNLRLLDLSGLDRSVARDHTLLINLSAPQTLPHLRVLKFANNGLHDGCFRILAEGFRTRLYSLDLSGNHLTDGIIPLLLKRFFPQGGDDNHQPSQGTGPNRTTNGIGSAEHDSFDLPTNASDDDNDEFAGLAIPETISDWVEYFATEEEEEEEGNLNGSYSGGLRCLHIGYNDITVEGISALLGETRLRKLDCGILELPEHSKRPGTEGNDQALAVEDLYKTSLSMNGHLWGNLRYLRLNHQYITGDCEILDNAPKPQHFRDFGGLAWWPEWSASQKIPIVRSRARWDELGSLEVLTLTEVPTFSRRGYVTNALLQFIQDLGVAAERADPNPWKFRMADMKSSTGNITETNHDHVDADTLLPGKRRNSLDGGDSKTPNKRQRLNSTAKTQAGGAFDITLPSLKELRLEVALFDKDVVDEDEFEDAEGMEGLYDPSAVSDRFLDAIGCDDWTWKAYTRQRQRTANDDPAIDQAFKEALRKAKQDEIQHVIPALCGFRSFTRRVRNQAEKGLGYDVHGGGSKAHGQVSASLASMFNPHWSGKVVLQTPPVSSGFDDVVVKGRLVI